MRIVIALGGNALLRRGQAITAQNQLENIAVAARSLANIATENDGTCGSINLREPMTTEGFSGVESCLAMCWTESCSDKMLKPDS